MAIWSVDKQWWVRVFGGVLAVGLLLVLLVSGGGNSGPPWKIHVIIGITHKTSPSFRETLEFVLARQQAQINEKGGIAGRDVEILIHNDRVDGPEGVAAKTLAEKLSADPDTLVVTGFMSSMRVNPAIPIYDRAKIRLIGGFSDSRELKKSASTYSVGVSIEDESEYLKQFLLTGKDKTLLLYRQNDDYALHYLQQFGFHRVNAELQKHQVFPPTQPAIPLTKHARLGLEYPRKMKGFSNQLTKDLDDIWNQNRPETIVLALGASRNAQVYNWVRKRRHKVQMFSLVGKITGGFTTKTQGYPYGVVSRTNSIPNVTNIEIERYVNQQGAFFFADSQRLKYVTSALGYADRINMVLQALALQPEGDDVRARIVAGLK
jgi:hypothetical protein